VDVYTRFVRDFEARLNPLRLVEMGVKVSKEIDSAFITFLVGQVSCNRIDPADHLGFLTDLLSRIDKDNSQEAYVLLLATISRAKLVFGDIEGTKAEMDAAWKVLDELTGVDTGVNAAYYSVAADYYKVRTQLLHIRLS
jgi:26S proteasome regulatory subunit N9